MVKKKSDETKIAKFAPGDTVKVHVKIQEEEGKVRIQVFEGIVIKKRGGGAGETFTVRRLSYGEGVERIFPLNSPIIDRIQVIRKGKVRRARLYYLRDRKGKKAKVLEQQAEEKQEAEV
ncbi:MAG: 50S ribosomal protein L19 [Candidatus Omnitrophota bacterium]